MGRPSRNKSTMYRPVPSVADFDSEAGSSIATERFDSLFSTNQAPVKAKAVTASTYGIAFGDGKPSSKTSLGKVYYELENLPYLLLIDVDITTMEPGKSDDGKLVLDKNGAPVNQRTMVQSRRLRQQALQEYTEVNFDGLGIEQSYIAFDLEARSNQLDAVQELVTGIGQCFFPKDSRFGRTNRLIVPVREKTKVDEIFASFSQTKDLTRVKKELPKADKRANSAKTDRSITCTIVGQGILLDPHVGSWDSVSFNDVEDVRDTMADYERTIEDIAKDDKLTEMEKDRATWRAEEDKKVEEARKAEEYRKIQESVRVKREASDLYRHSIQLLFQHHWSSEFPGARLGNTSEFQDVSKKDWFVETVRQIHYNAPWQYSIRYKPRFDENLRLFFDYDLVPIMKNGVLVAEYAGYHFPANFSPGTTSMNQTLKKLLQGVHVNYPLAIKLKKNYGSIADYNRWKAEQAHVQKTADDQEDIEAQRASELSDGSDDQKECDELRNRTYTIRDIKANADVGLFIPITKLLPGGGEEKKFLNVKKYLHECQSALNALLAEDGQPEVDLTPHRFSHLPLADIGKKSSFWVPLDQLEFSGDQVLPHLHHLTDELQRLRKSLDPRTISELGVKLLNDLYESDPQKCVFKPDDKRKPFMWLPFPASAGSPYEPLTYTPLKPESRSRLVIKSGAPSPKLAVVYITSDIHSRSTKLFLADVRSALAREGNKAPHERVLEIDMDPDQISAGAVKSGPELFRLQDQKGLEDLRKVIDPTADVLIGIIDGHGMSQAKYLETAAEVKRLGDRKLGAVTVCLRKQGLEERIHRSGGSALFPLNVLRKIRFMLGSMNFETKELDAHLGESYREGLIVIGAHISQPASDSTEYCPAVAALVMSKPGNHSFYRAAARLQPTAKIYQQAYDNGDLPADACKFPKLKKLYQPRILELQETLEPMFRAWKRDGDGSSETAWPKNPRVVLYRDACHEIDPPTHENEVEQIRKAYRSVFGDTDDVPVTYVTVMRNRKIHSPFPEDKEGKADVCTPRFTFTTSEYAAKDPNFENDPLRKEDGAKYQYLVHSNGDQSEMNLGKLRDLTGLLNVSSQLCDYTSLALPVHYARKLARRVLSYYDYMSHKDISNYPSVAKLTPYESFTGQEQMNEVKQSLQAIAKRSKPWDWVREKTKECHTRPWSEKLDGKMFFL